MATTEHLPLNSGMRCAKYMLLVINFMFSITAVLLIMVGSTIQVIFGDLQPFLDDQFSSPPALLIAVGFIMLFVATLGAYGAIKESVMLINLYGVCLFLVFILEVAASIAAFVMQGQINEMLVRTMTESMSAYETNQYIQASVDFMQTSLECCGVDGPKDWLKYMNQTKYETNDEFLVPYSCCGRFILDHNKQTCEKRYKSGCFSRMVIVISQSTILIGAGAATVALVQLLGVICAFMLAKALRRSKSIREVRRWQLQQSLGVLMPGEKVDASVNSDVAGIEQLEHQNTNSSTIINE